MDSGAAPLAPLIVALDGPSGSGKSSVSRAVAVALGIRYLDTGAMYRALTWWCLEQGIAPTDASAITAAVQTPSLCAGTDPSAPTITVDGVDVCGPIRGPEVTAAVSAVSAVPAVRTRLVALQQAIIERCCRDDGGIVVEGRDIGTVVAPDAPVKIFLTASIAARADRRSGELTSTGAGDPSGTAADLARRDQLDSARAVAPLLQAVDAVELDSTDLDQEQVVAAVLAEVRQALGKPVGGDVAHQ